MTAAVSSWASSAVVNKRARQAGTVRTAPSGLGELSLRSCVSARGDVDYPMSPCFGCSGRSGHLAHRSGESLDAAVLSRRVPDVLRFALGALRERPVLEQRRSFTADRVGAGLALDQFRRDSLAGDDVDQPDIGVVTSLFGKLLRRRSIAGWSPIRTDTIPSTRTGYWGCIFPTEYFQHLRVSVYRLSWHLFLYGVSVESWRRCLILSYIS